MPPPDPLPLPAGVHLHARVSQPARRTLMIRLGFADDAEFALDRETRVIHVRSASRVGYSDLGKNRGRVEELREALGDRLTSP